MMIVCFGDGLGNQMFQYAFYKALIKNYYGIDLKMDIFHVYGPLMHNGFELDKIFNIKCIECEKKHALILSDYFPLYLKRYYLINQMHKVRRLFFGKKASWIEQDDATVFYKEIFELSSLKSYIFRGNWINEMYFNIVAEDLKYDFTFKIPLDINNSKIKERIESCESISVHIRRGDYLKTKMYNLDDIYYKKAFSIIERNIENPYYFFFSDDKEFIREHFGYLKNYYIVEGNTGNLSYIDMQLMSICKHNIIANSTFSFWGAYLNKNDNKIIIAPQKAADIYREPFACKSWIKI